MDKSIAVLPFVNMSADADNEYFSDGLSEELLNLLARVDGLKVAARTSTFKFKDSEADIAQIGEQLNVATVLEGSVRKSGDQVRITAQLIKVDDGFHLWSETYDRELDNIFEVQDEIARAIVGALKLPLLGEGSAALSSQSTASFEAYDLFLLGRHHHQMINAASFEKAIDYYTRALAIDPGYAPAWAALASAQLALADYGGKPIEEATRQAGKAIEKAVAINPELAEVLVAQSMLARYTGRSNDTRIAAERALEFDPQNVWALSRLSTMLLVTDPPRSLELAQRAMELDPLAEQTRVRLLLSLARAKGPDVALARAREMLLDEPDNPGLFEAMGNINLWQGKLDQSIADFAMTHRLRPGDVFPAMRLNEIYLYLDDPAAAAKWVAAAYERGPDNEWARIAENLLDVYEGNPESMLSRGGELLSGNANLMPEQVEPLSLGLLQAGRREDAERLLRAAVARAVDSEQPIYLWYDGQSVAWLAHLLPEGAERDELMQRLQDFVDTLSRQLPADPQTLLFRARLAALNGDRDGMLTSLQQAVDHGLRGARWLRMEPVFEAYTNDPAFQERVLELEQISAEAQSRMSGSLGV